MAEMEVGGKKYPAHSFFLQTYLPPGLRPNRCKSYKERERKKVSISPETLLLSGQRGYWTEKTWISFSFSPFGKSSKACSFPKRPRNAHSDTAAAAGSKDKRRSSSRSSPSLLSSNSNSRVFPLFPSFQGLHLTQNQIFLHSRYRTSEKAASAPTMNPANIFGGKKRPNKRHAIGMMIDIAM